MRIREKILTATSKYKYAYHLVFTIKDGQQVRERSVYLRESLKRWRKIRGGEYSKAKAALISHELKEGKYSKQIHAHAHAIIWTDETLDYVVYNQQEKKELEEKYGTGNIPKQELDKCTPNYLLYHDNGNEAPSIQHCSKLTYEWHNASRGEATNIQAIPLFGQKSFKTALSETIKYATKFNQNHPSRALEILSHCSGLRFFSTCRYMRFDIQGGEQPPEYTPRPDSPVRTLNYQWDRKTARYSQWEPGEPIIKGKDIKKRPYLQQQAVELANYRKTRSAMIKQPPDGIPLYIALDRLKYKLRQRIREIWRSFESMNWTPHRALNQLERARTAAKPLLEIGFSAEMIAFYAEMIPDMAPG